MTDLLVYTIEEMAEAKREAFEQGWYEGFRAAEMLIGEDD